MRRRALLQRAASGKKRRKLFEAGNLLLQASHAAHNHNSTVLSALLRIVSMSDSEKPSLSRQTSFSTSEFADARDACMAFPCSVRGKVADALRQSGETWSGTSWERKLELLRAEAPLHGRAKERRSSAIGALAMGIYSAVKSQTAADILTGFKYSNLRKFRLLAKKALWTTRKDALSRRSSLWWGIESHLRVQRCRAAFEVINKSRKEYENLPPLEYEAFLNKLFASIPAEQKHPAPNTIRAPQEDDSPLFARGSSGAAPEPVHPWIILPNSVFRTAWDTLTLFLLLYCAFSVPAQMSFSSDIPLHFIPPGQEDALDSSAENETSWPDYIDLSVDAIFMLDVVFNFRTAFFREHSTRSMVIESRGRVIALRYIKTSFLPDVLSSLPYQWISPLINEVAGFSKVPRLFKLVRLLRLIKLIRLTRVSRTAANFKAYIGMTRAVSRAASFLLVFSLIVHIIACVLYFCGTLNFRDPDGYLHSWLASATVLIDSNVTRVMDAPAGVRYAYSLYWAIAIIETIGYGDIQPSQPSTVFALLIVMLVGVFVYSYLMGNVTSIVNLFDGLEARSLAALEEMQRFNHMRKVPHHLTERLDKWFMLE